MFGPYPSAKEYYDGQGGMDERTGCSAVLDLKTNTFNYDIPDRLAKMGVDKRLRIFLSMRQRIVVRHGGQYFQVL